MKKRSKAKKIIPAQFYISDKKPSIFQKNIESKSQAASLKLHKINHKYPIINKIIRKI